MDNPTSTRSRAAIAGHPIHPMLVPFPIAFLVGVLVSDIIQRATGDAFWARGSTVLLVAALVMGALAALAGLVDFSSIPRARVRDGWMHAGGNVLAVGLSVVNLILRLNGPAGTVTTPELVISIVVGGILVMTGWLGGELVFRHHIGAE